jgi:nucleoid DNA-binding protein
LDLAPIIHELILHNECIILPGFGGFETEYLPARFESDKGMMLPPSKNIVFKEEYTSGGEILKNHLVQKLSIRDGAAEKIIQDYINQLKLKLSETKSFELKGFGALKKDISGKITFEAEKEENYLAESFGLEPLPYKEGKKLRTVPKITHKPVEPVNEIKIRKRSSTLTFVVVGIMVICLLLTATIILSSKFDLYLFDIGNKHTQSDMLVFGGNTKMDSAAKKINSTINESTSIKNALSYSGKKQVSDSRKQSKLQHYLVAGSFDSKGQALSFERKLKSEGFSTEVVQLQGKYRVCVGKFSDKIVAQDELTRISRQMSRSVWLLTIYE